MIAGTNVEKIIFERKLNEVQEQLREIEERVRTGVKTSPYTSPLTKFSKTIAVERN